MHPTHAYGLALATALVAGIGAVLSTALPAVDHSLDQGFLPPAATPGPTRSPIATRPSWKSP